MSSQHWDTGKVALQVHFYTKYYFGKCESGSEGWGDLVQLAFRNHTLIVIILFANLTFTTLIYFV